MEYLPLSLGLNGSWRTPKSTLAWGVGLSANLWRSAAEQDTTYLSVPYTNQITHTTNYIYTTSVSGTHGAQAVQGITGSGQSSGYWVAITPNVTYNFQLITNWETILRLDGQVSSEPLISSEQFGIGGVNSVRGYHEGEAFGDDGWHVSFEQMTPPRTVGMVFGHLPLVVRGSIYMDYGQVYSLNAPTGVPDSVGLWGTGVGCVASIGSFWETRFLFSVPLLKTADTTTFQPFFNFALTAQF
jgi:hemolysin activation/secretion protein